MSMVDTYGLGSMLDGEFFKKKMPVKMKFAVTGCQNGCAKSQANDSGVMGIIKCAIINLRAKRTLRVFQY